MIDMVYAGLLTFLLVFLTGVWIRSLICTGIGNNQWSRVISRVANLIAGFTLLEISVFSKNRDLNFVMRFIVGSVLLYEGVGMIMNLNREKIIRDWGTGYGVRRHSRTYD